MAFQAGAIVSQLTLDRSKFSASIKAVQKQTKSLGGWVKKNSGQFKAMGLAIAAMGAAALLTFKKMVSQYVETGDMIHKMALRTSFAAETLSELAYAADISGADITMLEKGVKKMSKTIVDASYGLETYLRVFRSLGLEIDDLMEMDPEKQFLTIGNAIASIENPTIQAAAAVDVFGRSGTMLLPLFKEGAEGMAKLREEAHTLGIVFDMEAATKAAKLKDAQTALKGSIQGVSIAILNDLIPVITDVVKKSTDWFVKNREHAATWTKSLLGAFQFIAKGIQGMLLAWQGLKTGVFTVAQAITQSITKIAEGLLWIAELTPGTEIFYAEKLRDIIRDMKFVSEGYREEKEKGIDTITNIIVKYEAFVATLNKVKTGIKGVKEETKTFGTVLEESILPATRDMTGVLEAAVPEMDKYIAATERMNEAQKTFSEIAINEFAIMEATIKDFVDVVLKVFERWALGQIIPKIMAALPFPANLLATAGAIATIKSIFAGIRGLAGGGPVAKGEQVLVGERGPELFAPNTAGEIIPLRDSMRMRIIIQNRIIIGEQVFYRESVKNVNKAGELGDLRIPNKVVV